MPKVEIGTFFREFHLNARLEVRFTPYFVTLVLMVDYQMSLGEFGPISLRGCLYKLVAMVLAIQLGDCLVPKNQSVFIRGWHLTVGVVVVNEVLHYAKKVGQVSDIQREF